MVSAKISFNYLIGRKQMLSCDVVTLLLRILYLTFSFALWLGFYGLCKMANWITNRNGVSHNHYPLCHLLRGTHRLNGNPRFIGTIVEGVTFDKKKATEEEEESNRKKRLGVSESQ